MVRNLVSQFSFFIVYFISHSIHNLYVVLDIQQFYVSLHFGLNGEKDGRNMTLAVVVVVE